MLATNLISQECCITSRQAARTKQSEHRRQSSSGVVARIVSKNSAAAVRLYCSILLVSILSTSPAGLVNLESIGASASSEYRFRQTSSCPGLENVTGRAQTDRSSETEYDKLLHRQAELCRQGKVGAPGQLPGSCSMWRAKYIDEQNPAGFEVRVVDKSLDERLANVVYTSITTKPVVPEYFTVTGENASEMEQNIQSLEGPWVHAEQCNWQLRKMTEQLDDLEARLEAKRGNSSLELGLNESHIRLARVMDSYGRYEAGMLLGKLHVVGAFTECTSSQLLLPARQTAGNSDRGQRGEELVRTRFCWANMDLSKHRSASLKARQTDPFEASEHMLQLGVCLPRSCHTRSFLESRTRNRAAAGAAQPSDQQVQQNRELLQRLIDSQFKLPGSLYIDESLPLHSVFCLADEQSAVKVPLSGKLALAFVGVWLLVAVYATYYQEMGRKLQAGSRKKSDDAAEAAAGAIGLVGGNFVESHKWAQEVVDCLNLKKSWQDFVGEDYDREAGSVSELPQRPIETVRRSPEINLDTLNVIKVFGCMLVVFGHAFVFMINFSVDSLFAMGRFSSDPIALATLAATLIVDTFFVISGILTGYLAMKRFARQKSAAASSVGKRSNGQLTDNGSTSPVAGGPEGVLADGAGRKPHEAILFLRRWLRAIVARYLRIVPIFFLVFWLKRSVLIYSTNFGMPYMDNGFNERTAYGSCKRESWWSPLSMMPAFLPLSQQCLPQAWSVASDLFFTIALEPIVLIMTKRPKLALLLGSFAGLLSWSWAIMAHLAPEPDREAEIIHLRGAGFAALFGSSSYLYTYPHHRLASILVGFLFGYMIFNYETNERQPGCRGKPQWHLGWPTRLSFIYSVGAVVMLIYVNEIKHSLSGYERYLFSNLHVTGRVAWVLANGILFTRMATDWRNHFLMRQASNKFWATLVKLNLIILLIHIDVIAYQMSSSFMINYYGLNHLLSLFGPTYIICVPLAIFIYIVYDNPMSKLTKRHVLALF